MWSQRIKGLASGQTINDQDSNLSDNVYDSDEETEALRLRLQETYESQMHQAARTSTNTSARGSVYMHRNSSAHTNTNTNTNTNTTGEDEDDVDRSSFSPSDRSSKNFDIEKVKEDLDDDESNDIPDGGFRAWLCVLGAFCGITVTFGISNGTGTIQNYLATEILTSYSDSEIGWIFSLWLFIMYAGSVQTGPIFDAFGATVLLVPGCIGWTVSMFMLSLCKEYYQFILGFSVLGGISTSMIFNPSVAVLGQWFSKHRSLATGISFLGGSAGGVFVPLMLNELFPRIGYGWSIRVLAFIVLGLSIVTCLTARGRTTRDDVNWREALPDIKSLKNFDFSAVTAGVFFVEWGFFVPVIYLVSYAKAQGLSAGYSNALIAFLNVGSSVGRVGPGYIADRYGCFNVVIASCFITGILSLALWIPAGTTKAGLTAFVVLWGFSSGSTISATPNCVASISPPSDFGKRYGTAYSLASLAVLTGTPIAGALTENNFLGLQLFSGCSYMAAGAVFLAARIKAAGWTPFF